MKYFALSLMTVAMALTANPASARFIHDTSSNPHFSFVVENGKVVTADAHIFNPSDGSRELGNWRPFRVFDITLGGPGLFEFTASNPGTNSASGTFTPASFVGFNMLDGLRRWENGNFDTYLDPGTQETLTIDQNAFTAFTSSTGFVAGEGTAVRTNDSHANQGGRHHSHFTFILDSLDAGGPREGIYLLEVETFNVDSVGDPLLDSSDPLWLVLRTSTIGDAEFNSAISFVETNIVPEPAGVLMLGLGGLGLLARRRNRR